MSNLKAFSPTLRSSPQLFAALGIVVASAWLQANAQTPRSDPPSSTAVTQGETRLSPFRPPQTARPGEIPYQPIAAPDELPPSGLASPPDDPRDFQGVWLFGDFTEFTTVEGKAPPLNAAGQNLFWHRRAMENAGTPVASPATLCMPGGVIVQLAATHRIVQTSEQVLFLFEELHGVWQIHLNQKHPDPLTPGYIGHAVGHWEGDTLVVDIKGFNGKTWLEFAGTPHSDAMHVIMRISKTDQGRRMRYIISVDDPKMYREPFTIQRISRWRPDLDVPESNCENAPPVTGHAFEGL